MLSFMSCCESVFSFMMPSLSAQQAEKKATCWEMQKKVEGYGGGRKWRWTG